VAATLAIGNCAVVARSSCAASQRATRSAASKSRSKSYTNRYNARRAGCRQEFRGSASPSLCTRPPGKCGLVLPRPLVPCRRQRDGASDAASPHTLHREAGQGRAHGVGRPGPGGVCRSAVRSGTGSTNIRAFLPRNPGRQPPPTVEREPRLLRVPVAGGRQQRSVPVWAARTCHHPPQPSTLQRLARCFSGTAYVSISAFSGSVSL
jgi:hypothetical protein